MSIDEELKQAGLLTIEDLMNGQPMDGFMAHAGVNDIDKFSEWLDMRYKEMLTAKARMILDKNDDGELFEWVISHCAVLNEVRVNFKAAKNVV